MSVAGIILIAVALAVLTTLGLVFRRIWLDLRVERRRGLNRRTAGGMDPEKADARGKACVSVLALLAPGLSFLIAYLVAEPVADRPLSVATAVFMTVAVVATLASRSVQRKVWPLPWTTLLILVAGALTIWLRDETFIKMRLTVQSVLGSLLAAFGVATTHERWEEFKTRFDDYGQRWMKGLVVTWGLFVAAANELVWRNTSTVFWLGFQIWGPILIFALAMAVSLPVMRTHFIGTCKVRTVE